MGWELHNLTSSQYVVREGLSHWVGHLLLLRADLGIICETLVE